MNNYGINHSLIIVAEAAKQEDGNSSMVKFADGEVRLGGIGTYIAHKIMEKSSAECRVTTLGHVQKELLLQLKTEFCKCIWSSCS